MEKKQYTRFKELLFPSNPPFSSYSCEGSRGIGPLSLVNIFIGANNSGKSRLLRSLFSLAKFAYMTNTYSAREFHEIAKQVDLEIAAIFGPYLHTVGNITKTYLSDILKQDPIFLQPDIPIYQILEGKLEAIQSASGTFISSENENVMDAESYNSRLRPLGEKALAQFKGIKFDADVGGKKRYYIPILRGMRPLDDKHSDLYGVRTTNDYFKNTGLPDKDEIFTGVFTGLELYKTLKSKKLGDDAERESIKNFEGFLSRNFFVSQRIELTPRDSDSTVYIRLGNESSRPIYDLGDGLQNLIICTFNIFMEKERSLFFIEEPDMCMHPALQRSFLEVLTEFDQHQYFLTTHSNHFLDMTLDFTDISVFHLEKIGEKEPKFQIRVASTGDRNVLRDLGVRNSSVFLTNATIWVEGITDRLYLRAYMNKYLESLETENTEQHKKFNALKEDYHYSFVEYQGSNLVHWNFDPNDESDRRIQAAYMTAHAFVLADGDIESKGVREEDYRSMLQDRFFILKSKEIENLMPLEVLKSVVTAKFKKYGRDTDAIRYEDYSKKGIAIGKYLDGLLNLPDGQTVFAGKSGTLKDKEKERFCREAVEIMNEPSFEWSLTPELKELCNKIFSHICRENPN